MEAIYEEDVLLHCVGIFPAFSAFCFVWQFFLKDWKRQYGDPDAGVIGICRQ
jgi:hypothetical protein